MVPVNEILEDALAYVIIGNLSPGALPFSLAWPTGNIHCSINTVLLLLSLIFQKIKFTCMKQCRTIIKLPERKLSMATKFKSLIWHIGIASLVRLTLIGWFQLCLSNVKKTQVFLFF